MAHSVFISWSSKDKAVAQAICTALEARGIACWIAPRNILPGADWSESIIDAINASKVFILVFTSSANESKQVRQEVQNAFDKGLPIIPVRAENVVPSKSLQYFLSACHWLDAFAPPLSEHLNYLAEVVSTFVTDKHSPSVESETVKQTLSRPKQQDRRAWIIGGGISVAAFLGLGAWGAKQLWGSGNDALSSRVSLTVLPFRNLSDDRKKEFFSDGQTDAVATALTNVKGLTVVGQASVFSLKPKLQDPVSIGRALNVNYLIDGSVRWSEEKVSVSANLIKVGDDTSLWAQSYDRPFSDVLATQEFIAQNIASAVQGPLGLPGVQSHSNEQIRRPATLDNETALNYLRARALLRARAEPEPGGPLTKAAALLEQVVTREPRFAPGWALLVPVYGFISTLHALYFSGSYAELRDFYDTWIPKAENAAARGIALAPESSATLTSLGLVQNFRGKFVEAEDSYRKALQIDPNNTDALHLYSLMLLCLGKVSDAASLRGRLAKLEPLVVVYNAFTATSFWLQRSDSRAINLFKTALAPAARNPYVTRQLALIRGTQGDFREAAGAVLKTAGYNPEMVQAAATLMAKERTAFDQAEVPLGFFSVLNVFTASPERALDYFEMNLRAGMWAATDAVQFWHPSPSFEKLRNSARFTDLMNISGASRYWRERGGPDGSCRSGRPKAITCA